MRAFVLRSYGASDQLTLTELDRPVPGPDEVLVRVRATSVNPYDWHTMRGEPYVARLMPGGLGLRRPKLHILGGDVAGTVEAVGRDATGFTIGDNVFALIKEGGFAEYVCVRADLLAPMPANLSYEQAASMPMAAVTALVGLRAGRLAAGQAVLVNGASGGVGTFAVQIARALGATVTAVCGTRNLDLVRSIGADHAVDYTARDFTRQDRRYDLLLDIAGGHSVLSYRRVVRPDGAVVVVGGPAGRWLQPAGHAFSALAVGPFVPQRMALADTVRYQEKRQALVTLAELVDSRQVTPVIDRRYGFEEIPEAVAYQERGHASGKVVVSV